MCGAGGSVGIAKVRGAVGSPGVTRMVQLWLLCSRVSTYTVSARAGSKC